MLSALKPDVALNVLHGRPGEDGTLQGVLEILGIPYSHSGVLASAVAMQKDYAKAMFRAAGMPVPRASWRRASRRPRAHLMPPPYVIKPIAEGSSVGVFIVTEEHAHPPQELYREDWAFGEEVLIERYIPGKELTCAVMGDRALDVIEIVPTTAVLRLRGKIRRRRLQTRAAGANFTKCLPRGPKTALWRRINALGCRGVSRADFRSTTIEGTGKLVCLEVNTQPGMTETSLVPELAAYAGITFDELVRWMVEDASTQPLTRSREPAAEGVGVARSARRAVAAVAGAPRRSTRALAASSRSHASSHGSRRYVWHRDWRGCRSPRGVGIAGALLFLARGRSATAPSSAAMCPPSLIG